MRFKPSLFKAASEESWQCTMCNQLRWQIDEAVIRVILCVIDPRVFTAHGSFFHLRRTITDQFPFKRMVMSQQLPGNDGEAPYIGQAGQ